MSQPAPLNPLTLPLHGSRLIEASAGTGKTFTIALLYVRLVLGGSTVTTTPPSYARSPRQKFWWSRLPTPPRKNYANVSAIGWWKRRLCFVIRVKTHCF